MYLGNCSDQAYTCVLERCCNEFQHNLGLYLVTLINEYFSYSLIFIDIYFKDFTLFKDHTHI